MPILASIGEEAWNKFVLAQYRIVVGMSRAARQCPVLLEMIMHKRDWRNRLMKWWRRIWSAILDRARKLLLRFGIERGDITLSDGFDGEITLADSAASLPLPLEAYLMTCRSAYRHPANVILIAWRARSIPMAINFIVQLFYFILFLKYTW